MYEYNDSSFADANWAARLGLTLGFVALLAPFAVFVIQYSSDQIVGPQWRAYTPHLLAAGLALAASAVVLGHLGVPDAGRDSDLQDKNVAYAGLILGHTSMFLILALCLLLQADRLGMDMSREQAPFRVQDGMIAGGMAACDLTMADSLLSGDPFSCARAQGFLELDAVYSLTLADNGPNSCTITALYQGSSRPTTAVWAYAP